MSRLHHAADHQQQRQPVQPKVSHAGATHNRAAQEIETGQRQYVATVSRFRPAPTTTFLRAVRFSRFWLKQAAGREPQMPRRHSVPAGRPARATPVANSSGNRNTISWFPSRCCRRDRCGRDRAPSSCTSGRNDRPARVSVMARRADSAGSDGTTPTDEPLACRSEPPGIAQGGEAEEPTPKRGSGDTWSCAQHVAHPPSISARSGKQSVYS